jgi:hypothetical protein
MPALSPVAALNARTPLVVTIPVGGIATVTPAVATIVAEAATATALATAATTAAAMATDAVTATVVAMVTAVTPLRATVRKDPSTIVSAGWNVGHEP